MSWAHSTIGDVLSVIQNGINCKQAKDGIGDKISRIETISDGTVNFNKVGYAVLSESEKHKAKLHKNDILFSHINSPIHVGKTALFAEEEILYHGINLLRLRVNGNVDSRFFNYFLNRLFWSGYWKKTAKQSVNQASVNQTDIKVVPFSYPPITEQQRIVAILDQAFADIEKVRANAERNLKNARELFDSYLNQVFEEKVDTKVFKKKMLLEVCSLDKKQGHYTGLPYIGMEHIESMTGRFTGDMNAVEVKSSTFKFTKEHVLYGRLRPYLNKVFVPDFDVGHCSTEIMPLMVSRELERKYLFYWLSSSKIVEKINHTCTGARMPRANMKEVMSLEIPVPSISEQNNICTILDKLANSQQELAASYEVKILSLDELKKSLLQKAFSGELTKTEGHAA